ncbi:MAG: tetratricopeptide repeat protein [Pseudomonadota bacterium]
MSLPDVRGVPTSSDNQSSLDTFEVALNEALSIRGDAVATIDGGLEADPAFVMGHCLRASLQLMAMERALLPDVARQVELAESLTGAANHRERGHIAAARAWLRGNLEEAVGHWEAVLLEFPLDLLALFSAHMADFYLGDPVQMRDRIARARRAWTPDVPGFGFVLGMHAFCLEESGDYSQAEEMARHAVEINSKDVYAIHAAAHVMEMQGRQQDGIDWMTARKSDWVDSGFSIHLWWHLGLYHLELGQIDRVIEIYDEGVRNKSSEISLEELDAAAMLWRLNLMGVDVSHRWGELADKWEPSAEDTHYAFNDMHAMMTFAGDGRDMAAARLLAAAASYVTERGGTNANMTKEAGIPICRGLLAFSRENYEATVDLLLPVRYKSFVFGGSYAQRDVISLTLIEAALRAKRYNLAHALLAERIALKPSSPLNWRSMARALDGLNDAVGAQKAWTRAAELVAA